MAQATLRGPQGQGGQRKRKQQILVAKPSATSGKSDAGSQSLAQKGEILTYLQKGCWITPMDALRLFGCFRLGARIWDLKKEGHHILTKMIEFNGKRFASYGF